MLCHATTSMLFLFSVAAAWMTAARQWLYVQFPLPLLAVCPRVRLNYSIRSRILLQEYTRLLPAAVVTVQH